MYDGTECELSIEPLSVWQVENMHVIAVLEVLPVACAMSMWAKRAMHRRVFCRCF